jgi:ribosome-associated translation inhibitor RaiA
MNIEYYYKNVEALDEELKQYVENKLKSVEKIVEFEKVRVEVSERKDKKLFMAVKIVAKNREEFRSEHHGKSFEECIDVIEDELKPQIRKAKGKKRDLAKRGGRSLKKKMTIDVVARL